jgi:site-specific DNA-methyltransferase (adenine-specific)
MDPEHGLPSLADKSVDHVITDPPYEAEAHTLQRRFSSGAATVVECPVSFAPIGLEYRVAVAAEMARVARRWMLVFCQAEAVAAWRDAFLAAGAKYKRACVWIKPDGQPQLTGDRPGMGYESMVTAHSPGRSRWNGGGKHGVYTVSKHTPAGEKTGHETQKPLTLMEALIRDFTDPGETILDPFAGSGTTLVAAKRLGRSAIGMEMNNDYADAARKRIERCQQQHELFEGAL